MIDFIYTLFIAPLEFWMEKALLWGFDQTHAWGWAIIVMSLVVNIVILPIYMKAESWQEQEREIRKSFEAKEAMIKKVFKGQERFAMITTMHRQAGFSPLLSMRSSIGFFLQIPFFFAAYHFLSNFEPLSGISFMGLTDLAKPDEMISVAGFSINVMPILMTVINLASALIYTANLSRKDKIQLYGMAAIFLVLLYDAASGLVLYWTCNNIFSLGKNIVYDLYHRFGASTITRIKTWMPSRKHEEEKLVYGKWYDGYLIYLWGAASVLALLSSNQMDLLADAIKVHLSFASDILFLVTAGASLFECVRLRIWKKHPILLILSILVIYYGVNTWCKWYFSGANRHYFALIAGILFMIPVFGLTNLKASFKALLFPKGEAASLYTPAVAWLIILTTAYLPIEAFCTAPEIFSPTADVLALLLRYSATAIIFFWVMDKIWGALNMRNFAGYFFALISLLFTVYAFLLPMDVGTIDAFQILNPEPLYVSKNLLVDFAVFVVFFAGFIWATRHGKFAVLRSLFTICTVLGICAATVSLWQSQGQWQLEAHTKETAKLPEFNDRLLGFSKTQTNVVVLMLDAFTGSHIDILMNENPELQDKYQGFTWYRNTVGTSNLTVASLPSIVCGSDCTPWELNKIKNQSLAETINQKFALALERLGPNFDLVFHERNWLEPARLKAHLNNDVLAVRYLGDSYVNRYINQNNLSIGKGQSDSFLLAISLFNEVPWSMKNLIYKEGRWIERLMPASDMLVFRQLRDFAFIDSLSELSNTNATQPTYKFLDNEVTHKPWFMDAQTCRVTPKPAVYQQREGVVDELHLATEACTLSALTKWFDWMRKEGIYDNTLIILVSDHDCGDSDALAATFGDNYKQHAGWANALLMVKPLNHNAPFHVSDQSISIATVPLLIDYELGNLGQFPEQMDRRTALTKGRTGNQFIINRLWTVQQDAFQASSWSTVKVK